MPHSLPEFKLWAIRPKLRTWGVLLLTSIFMLSIDPSNLILNMVGWSIAGTVILMRPRELFQQLIGLLYIGMVMFCVGFYMSGQADPFGYLQAIYGVLWLQWALLSLWAIQGKSLEVKGMTGHEKPASFSQ